MEKRLRKYCDDLAETREVIQWIKSEFVTQEAWAWAKKMFFVFAIMIGLDALQPFAVRYVFDGLVSGNSSWVIFGFVGFLVCFTAQKVTDYLKNTYREWFIGLNIATIDRRITELFFEKSLGQYVTHSSLLNVATMDRGRSSINNIQGTLVFYGTSSFLYMTLSWVAVALLSPLSGALFLLVATIYLLSGFYLNSRVETECHEIEEDFRRLRRHRFERWEKLERVALTGKKHHELSFMTERFDDILSKDRAFWLGFIRHCGLREGVNILVLALIFGIGAWNVWTGVWSVGLLYPLYSLSSRISHNMWQIGDIYLDLSREVPRVRSMMRALSLTPEVTDAPNAQELDLTRAPEIRFEGVSHRYPAEDTRTANDGVHTLKNVSFEIGQGEKLAVIGPSGAGKTSIAKLLLRYMDPEEGAITVNGISLKDIALSSWMRHVGVIAQDPQVFDNTLRYNITYGLSEDHREEIKDEDVWHLMKLLHIDFGKRLTAGLETRVGRSGMKLSGGEAQRLMIGAAAIKRPHFMIIDEATSSLDSTTEKEVQKGLADVLSGDVGALVIAHRLSTVRDLCDKFMVLKRSTDANTTPQVEAIAGSFEELYELSPTFRRLCDDQGVII
ncbi:hypothetical protein CL654_02465 [bacterium]|nr:hypothetical protein [bacterium]|tara:strand:+ start:4746 stop:6587 length:1842 start_codon:yes stop_codon:yes gene_type:complete